MVKIKKYNSAFITIIGDFEERDLIYSYYNLPVAGYWFMPLYKQGRWDGKISLFNKINNQLPSGLLTHLIEYLEKSNIEYQLSEELIIEQEPVDISDFEDALKEISKDIEKRDYQIEAIKNVLKYRNGIVEHATGAGKTIILYFLLHYLMFKKEPFKMLFVVPNIGLISQAVSDLEGFGINPELIGKYYSKVKDEDKLITIGTWQSLRKNDKLLKSVNIVVADEAHGCKASEVAGLLKKCTNTIMRIGMTGTLPKDLTDRLSILGSFGRVLDKVTSYELIHEKKQLSKARILIANLHYPKDLKKYARKSYKDERKVIEGNIKRQQLFVSILNKLNKDNKNTLVLFDKIEFGRDYKEYFEKYIKDSDTTIYWVEGAVKGEDREEIRQIAKNSSNWIIFATLGTFSTGINIPNIHNIVFIWVGKSNQRIKQSIGRGLRLHESKDMLTIVDIADELRYGKKHLDERIQIYMQEGYPVTIKDFNKEKK